MKKSVRKANARLAKAKKYVASYKSKPVSAPTPAPVVGPTKVITKPKSLWVESAKIEKLEKGHFFVVVTCNGQRHEIQKRFKSMTKAREWIFNHGYIES